MTTILRNAARCVKCGDVVESTHRHDFVTCKCGAISVDGGHAYLRRVGNFGDFQDMSATEEMEPEGRKTRTELLEDIKKKLAKDNPAEGGWSKDSST
jgi:hypothetical protein